MRTNASPATERPPRGIALVLVLGFLVLLSALIIAFFTSVQIEMQSAKAYQSSVTVKQLISTATNVVTGQIAEGTRSTKTLRAPGTTSPVPAGERLAWASQPGMIRTWDDTGGGWKLFKLYSSASMVAELDKSGRYSTASELKNEVPDTWPVQTAIFTDLNEPVLVEDTAGKISGGKKSRASWPILDPLALGQGSSNPGVEGFRIDSPPGYGVSSATGPVSVQEADDPTKAPAPGRSGNPAAMPVRWIYVLRNGTLTVPTGFGDSEGRVASWSGSDHEPSRTNPIVGRIAFWTDDESCKLNVNTASEPTPWDTPRAFTLQDLNFGRYQPAQKEYQRFAGHPFMTALSPVLFPKTVLTAAQKGLIYDLIPRVADGGTKAGTQQMNNADPTINKVTLDEDRLFANVDEFLFEPSRTAVPADARYIALNLDVNRLRRSRFFLTANSRAPEVNLFGQPRISLWPVDTGVARRTAFDKLAAFCTTLGASANSANYYYFQRSDPKSPTVDYSGRNLQLYGYLQRLTAMNIPGYGGSFATSWQDDRSQILTEIFDYIRCTNLRDPQQKASGNYYSANGQVTPITIGTTKGFGRFHSISQFGMHFICSRDPSKATQFPPDGGVKDAGVLSSGERQIEAAFLFEPFSPSLGFYKLTEDMFYQVTFQGAWTIDTQDLKMQSAGKQLLNGIGQGYHNNGREHGGSGGIRGPIGTTTVTSPPAVGFGGASYPFVSKASPRVKVGASGATTMKFSGGTVEVKVYAGGNSSGPLVQTFLINFPGGTFPLPELVTTGTEGYRDNSGSNGPTAAADWWTLSSRYGRALDVPHAPGAEYNNPARRWDKSGNGTGGGAPGFKRGCLFRKEDVVRSVVPEHGDIRLIAANNIKFVKVRDAEWNGSYRFLHIFSNNSGPHFHFGFGNEPGPVPAGPNEIPGANDDDQLVWTPAGVTPVVKYHYSRLPEIRPGAGKLYNKWGDFDNGVAQWTDGSYINKPDEGNQSITNSTGGITYPYWSWNDSTDVTEVFFSPNRLVPSAGMLGSLSTGVKRDVPWQTLLFRPQSGHPGEGSPPRKVNPLSGGPPYSKPPDHLIMDLLWMPVVEPYAISEPFSTGGKINMNYEIAPFSYIRRATALHGAFRSEEPLLIPNAASKIYKLWDHESNDNGIMPDSTRDQDPEVRRDWGLASKGAFPFDKMRLPIDTDSTLVQFDERFAAGDIFRSASEICEMHLVRKGETLADYRAGKIWPQNLLTGDNTRERPYTNLYAKLTTRSNVFTVHIRAQVLRQSGNTSNWGTWREGRDQTVSDFRGSTIVERYIDPADPSLVDFATNADASVDNAYKLRVLATKKFAP
jgi:uncharacterized protein (TIGR02600 family)